MEINTILNSLTLIVIGIIAFFIKRYVNQKDEFEKNTIAKLERTDDRMDEIERNYLDRFQDIKDVIKTVEINVADRFAKFFQANNP